MLGYVKGYKIPFTTKVYQNVEPKNPPSPHGDMIMAILNLLQLGAISKCDELNEHFISPVFLTPKSTGGYRFILNLKALNKFLPICHFKMDDIRTVSKLVLHKSFMATIDLKESYFLVPVHKKHRKYLRFRYDKVLYEFNCLPYGHSLAPFVFTKLLKPVMSYLRNNNHTVVSYLDDVICIGDTYEACSNTVQLVVQTFENLGLVINFEKSCTTPNQYCKYLGFIINSNSMCLQLPPEKIQKIRNLISKIRYKESVQIRDFAKLIGTLTAACPAISYGWVYTKRLEREKYLALLRNNENYNEKMPLNPILREDFSWWSKLSDKNTNKFHDSHFHKEIFTDSSLTGWGAACDDEIARGLWSVNEQTQHINFLELLAAFLGLKAFCKNEKCINVLLRIDNTTAIAYINKMGGIQFPHLNSVTREIWQWCEQRKIYIFASYIRSRENTDADQASRYTNIDTEWELNPNLFRSITVKLGQPTIDLFASRLNKKCCKYLSWQRDPDAYDIDAFTVPWNTYFFYAFPPFAVILKCLRKIANDKATGIFLVPYWPSQPWYPLFKRLVASEIIIFNANKNNLLSPYREPHPMWRKLTLACAILSGSRI